MGVKAIKIRFTLLSKKNQLVIFTFISFEINKIGKNIVYIALKINNNSKKNY